MARDDLAALPEAEPSPHLGALIDHLPRSIHCADDSRVRPFGHCFADGTSMSPLGQGALMFCRALKTRLQPGVTWSTTYHSVNFGGLAPSRWEVSVFRLSGE